MNAISEKPVDRQVVMRNLQHIDLLIQEANRKLKDERIDQAHYKLSFLLDYLRRHGPIVSSSGPSDK